MFLPVGSPHLDQIESLRKSLKRSISPRSVSWNGEFRTIVRDVFDEGTREVCFAADWIESDFEHSKIILSITVPRAAGALRRRRSERDGGRRTPGGSEFMARSARRSLVRALTVFIRNASAGILASSEGPAVPRTVGERRRRRSVRDVGRRTIEGRASAGFEPGDTIF